MRAQCLACGNGVEVEKDAVERCPHCGSRYSLQLLGEPPGQDQITLGPAYDSPLDWVRVAIGWSMFATLAVVLWYVLDAGSASGGRQSGSLGVIAALTAITYATLRVRMVRFALTIVGIILLALWMWG